MSPAIRRALATASVALCFSAHAEINLVTNGDFETGTLDGWTVENAGTPDYGIDALPFEPITGHASANFYDIVPEDAISQLLTTMVGRTYRISFSVVSNEDGTNAFTAGFGATTLLALNDLPSGPPAQYSFDLVAVDPTTLLRFAGFNEQGTTSLDDVVVTVLPEPTGLVPLALLAAAVARRASGRTPPRPR